jgi:hypothetical protein
MGKVHQGPDCRRVDAGQASGGDVDGRSCRRAGQRVGVGILSWSPGWIGIRRFGFIASISL